MSPLVEHRPGVGIVIPDGTSPTAAIIGALSHLTAHLPTNRERIHQQIAVAREVLHFFERILDGVDRVADVCVVA